MSFKSFAQTTAPLRFTPPPLPKPQKKTSAKGFDIATDLQPGDRIYYLMGGDGRRRVSGEFTRYGDVSQYSGQPEVWANWRGQYTSEGWMPAHQVFLEETA